MSTRVADPERVLFHRSYSRFRWGDGDTLWERVGVEFSASWLCPRGDLPRNALRSARVARKPLHPGVNGGKDGPGKSSTKDANGDADGQIRCCSAEGGGLGSSERRVAGGRSGGGPAPGAAAHAGSGAVLLRAHRPDG